MTNLFNIQMNETLKERFKANLSLSIVRFILVNSPKTELEKFLGAMDDNDLKEVYSVFVLNESDTVRPENLSKSLKKVSAKNWLKFLNTKRPSPAFMKKIWETSLRATVYETLLDIRDKSKEQIPAMKRCTQTVDKLYELAIESRLELIHFAEEFMFSAFIQESNFVIVTSDMVDYIYLTDWLDRIIYQMNEALFLFPKLSEMESAFATIDFESIVFGEIDEATFRRYLLWSQAQHALSKEEKPVVVFDTQRELIEKMESQFFNKV